MKERIDGLLNLIGYGWDENKIFPLTLSPDFECLPVIRRVTKPRDHALDEPSYIIKGLESRTMLFILCNNRKISRDFSHRSIRNVSIPKNKES